MTVGRSLRPKAGCHVQSIARGDHESGFAERPRRVEPGHLGAAPTP